MPDSLNFTKLASWASRWLICMIKFASLCCGLFHVVYSFPTHILRTQLHPSLMAERNHFQHGRICGNPRLDLMRSCKHAGDLRVYLSCITVANLPLRQNPIRRATIPSCGTISSRKSTFRECKKIAVFNGNNSICVVCNHLSEPKMSIS